MSTGRQHFGHVPRARPLSCGDGWQATTIVEQLGGSCLSRRTTGDGGGAAAVSGAGDESTATTGSMNWDATRWLSRGQQALRTHGGHQYLHPATSSSSGGSGHQQPHVH